MGLCWISAHPPSTSARALVVDKTHSDQPFEGDAMAGARHPNKWETGGLAPRHHIPRLPSEALRISTPGALTMSRMSIPSLLLWRLKISVNAASADGVSSEPCVRERGTRTQPARAPKPGEGSGFESQVGLADALKANSTGGRSMHADTRSKSIG